MKKTLFLLLFAALLFSSSAKADTLTDYTITFMGSPVIPTVGTVVYDSTGTPSISASIEWGGNTFNFSDTELMAQLITPIPGCTGSSAALVLAILQGCGGTVGWSTVTANGEEYFHMTLPPAVSCTPGVIPYCTDYVMQEDAPVLAADSEGTLSIVATPEPGTGGLMLIGVGMLGLVMRKRIAPGLPRAT